MHTEMDYAYPFFVTRPHTLSMKCARFVKYYLLFLWCVTVTLFVKPYEER